MTIKFEDKKEKKKGKREERIERKGKRDEIFLLISYSASGRRFVRANPIRGAFIISIRIQRESFAVKFRGAALHGETLKRRFTLFTRCFRPELISLRSPRQVTSSVRKNCPFEFPALFSTAAISTMADKRIAPNCPVNNVVADYSILLSREIGGIDLKHQPCD